MTLARSFGSVSFNVIPVLRPPAKARGSASHASSVSSVQTTFDPFSA